MFDLPDLQVSLCSNCCPQAVFQTARMEIRGRKINRFCSVHVCISTQLEQTLSLAWFKTEPEAAWVFMAVSLSATAGSFDQQSISVTRVQAATRAHPRTL